MQCNKKEIIFSVVGAHYNFVTSRVSDVKLTKKYKVSHHKILLILVVEL